MTTKNDKPISATSKTFKKEVVEAGLPVVVDFWAPWCGPCRAVAPVLDELASKWSGKVKVVKVNVDEEPEIAQQFQIRGIPTLVAMEGNEVVDVQVGARGRGALEQLFTSLDSSHGTASVA